MTPFDIIFFKLSGLKGTVFERALISLWNEIKSVTTLKLERRMCLNLENIPHSIIAKDYDDKYSKSTE